MDTGIQQPKKQINRIALAMRAGTVLGFIVHALLVPFFYFIDVVELAYVCLICALSFGIMFYLIGSVKQFYTMFFLQSLIIVGHTYFGLYYLGNECGYIFSIFVLLATFLLNARWLFWQRVAYFSIIIGAIVFGVAYSNGHEPIYKLTPDLIFFIRIIVTSTIGIIILTVIYYYSKVVNKNDLELKRINEQLLKQNIEKQGMLKEIHHRVKNNLQVVNSLLRLQSTKAEDENVVYMFEQAQKRVLSMALLHEKMYRSEDLQYVNAREHIIILIEDLVNSYAVEKKIQLDINIQEVDMGIQTLTPLGLIINELITNSIKYGFKGKTKGKITVHLKKLQDFTYEMIIGDNGVGFDSEEVTAGIGTKLIQIFIKQLEGSIERLDRAGAFFKLVFKEQG